MLTIHKQVLAQDDLIGIWIYTMAHWGVSQADLYLDAIDTALLHLAEHPLLGKESGNIRSGYRQLSVKEHDIFYRIEGILFRSYVFSAVICYQSYICKFMSILVS